VLSGGIRQVPKFPAAVFPRSFFKVLRDSCLGYFPYIKLFLQGVFKKEFPEIGGEDKESLLRQSLHTEPQEFYVVVLDGEGVFPVAVNGKGGGVDKDEGKSFPAIFKPFNTVLLNRYVLWASKTIQGEVGPGSLQAGSGNINGGSGNGIVHESVNGCTAGIAEKVENFFALCQFADHGTDRPVIEEKTSVEIICKIDQEPALLFPDLEQFSFSGLFVVLFFSFLYPAGFNEQAAGLDTEDVANNAQADLESVLRLFFVD
jgi:hypothetical protein